MLWMKDQLKGWLLFNSMDSMKPFCDNKVANSIANNPCLA